MSGSWNLNRKW